MRMHTTNMQDGSETRILPGDMPAHMLEAGEKRLRAAGFGDPEHGEETDGPPGTVLLVKYAPEPKPKTKRKKKAAKK